MEPDLRVVGHANNAAEVMQRVLELEPDILLLDLNMPLQRETHTSAGGGLHAWAAVKGTGCRTKAILFAAEMETQQIVEAIELGVRGFLLKSAATELLIDGIRAVMSGPVGSRPRRFPVFISF
jgi:DNA-binding NarL/FixJ family response regulator